MILKTTDTIKRIFEELGILTVYGLFIFFETINCCMLNNLITKCLFIGNITIIHVVIEELRCTI